MCRVIALLLLALAIAPVPAGARPGDLDPRFGDRGRARISLVESSTHARGLAVQPDGRVIVTGTGPKGWIVARLTASGRPDRSFGTRGRVAIDHRFAGAEPLALALMPDGRIVVGGSIGSDGGYEQASVIRLLGDGRLDPSWGAGGRAVVEAGARLFFGGLAVQPDGGVAVAGSIHHRDQSFAVWRLTPDGRRDLAFGTGGAYVDPEPGDANAVIARPDGRLLVGGATGQVGRRNRELLVALTSDGQVDPTWGQGGRFRGPSGSALLRLVAAPGGGAVGLDALPSQMSVLWLTPDGRRREEWGLDGRAALISAVHHGSQIAVDERRRVYVSASASFRAGDGRQEIAGVFRISATGVVERGFGGGDGLATVPTTRRTARSNGESVAVGAGERVYLAASGAGELQGFREDFGYTHALVARLKGWHPIVHSSGLQLAAGSARLRQAVFCTDGLRCRVRIDVLDRRGRRLGRAAVSPRRSSSVTRTIRLRRRLRTRERIRVRLSATEPGGRADTLVRRVRVPPRPRR